MLYKCFVFTGMWWLTYRCLVNREIFAKCALNNTTGQMYWPLGVLECSLLSSSFILTYNFNLTTSWDHKNNIISITNYGRRENALTNCTYNNYTLFVSYCFLTIFLANITKHAFCYLKLENRVFFISETTFWSLVCQALCLLWNW